MTLPIFPLETSPLKQTLVSQYPYYRYRSRVTYPYFESTDGESWKEGLSNGTYTDTGTPMHLIVCCTSLNVKISLFQSGLYPRHKQLMVKRSQRCRQCEHNLSKPGEAIYLNISIRALFDSFKSELSFFINLGMSPKIRMKYIFA